MSEESWCDQQKRALGWRGRLWYWWFLALIETEEALWRAYHRWVVRDWDELQAEFDRDAASWEDLQ